MVLGFARFSGFAGFSGFPGSFGSSFWFLGFRTGRLPGLVVCAGLSGIEGFEGPGLFRHPEPARQADR
jgi:hypothetical protein